MAVGVFGLALTAWTRWLVVTPVIAGTVLSLLGLAFGGLRPRAKVWLMAVVGGEVVAMIMWIGPLASSPRSLTGMREVGVFCVQTMQASVCSMCLFLLAEISKEKRASIQARFSLLTGAVLGILWVLVSTIRFLMTCPSSGRADGLDFCLWVALSPVGALACALLALAAALSALRTAAGDTKTYIRTAIAWIVTAAESSVLAWGCYVMVFVA